MNQLNQLKQAIEQLSMMAARAKEQSKPKTHSACTEQLKALDAEYQRQQYLRDSV